VCPARLARAEAPTARALAIHNGRNCCALSIHNPPLVFCTGRQSPRSHWTGKDQGAFRKERRRTSLVLPGRTRSLEGDRGGAENN
jgi:hypothetical protein